MLEVLETIAKLAAETIVGMFLGVAIVAGVFAYYIKKIFPDSF